MRPAAAYCHFRIDNVGACVAEDPPETPLETPLQRLILETCQTYGWSYRAVAERAGLREDGRPALHHNTVQRLATQRQQRSPSPRIVEALARGLNVPTAVVVAAVAESLGYREAAPGGREFSLAHALAERVDALDDDEERALILKVMERLASAAEAKKGDGRDDDAPGEQ